MSLARWSAVLSLAVAATAHAETWTYQGVPVSYSLDGAGPPVVQIHGIGAGASSEQTKYQIPALVNAGYRVYSIDLPGWGQSIGPNQLFTGPYYRDFLEAFLTDVVGEKAALVGHSLGATYAIAAAADKPDYVAALVLDSPVGVTSFTTESSAYTAAIWQTFVTGKFGSTFYTLLGSWPELRSFCKRQLYVDTSFCTKSTINDYYQYTQTPNSVYAAAAFLTGNLGLDVRSSYAGLTKPAVVIWGAENTLSPVSDASSFSALNAAIPVDIIESAGALVNDEQQALFDQAMLAVIQPALPAVKSPAVKK
jgi:pimeloyl-ACP methyl ester carboxylesterase